MNENSAKTQQGDEIPFSYPPLQSKVHSQLLLLNETSFWGFFCPYCTINLYCQEGTTHIFFSLAQYFSIEALICTKQVYFVLESELSCSKLFTCMHVVPDGLSNRESITDKPYSFPQFSTSKSLSIRNKCTVGSGMVSL